MKTVRVFFVVLLAFLLGEQLSWADDCPNIVPVFRTFGGFADSISFVPKRPFISPSKLGIWISCDPPVDYLPIDLVVQDSDGDDKIINKFLLNVGSFGYHEVKIRDEVSMLSTEPVEYIAELRFKLIDVTDIQIYSVYAQYREGNFIIDGSFTAVEKSEQEELDYRHTLLQNYPNPFNPTTTIHFELPGSGNVSVKVYDITGRLVNVLVSDWQMAGTQNTVWDGTDFDGSFVAAGIYICRIEFIGEDGKKLVQSKKMSFVK